MGSFTYNHTLMEYGIKNMLKARFNKIANELFEEMQKEYISKLKKKLVEESFKVDLNKFFDHLNIKDVVEVSITFKDGDNV